MMVGVSVGVRVGDFVGVNVGDFVGDFVGGIVVGDFVGVDTGENVGVDTGDNVGDGGVTPAMLFAYSWGFNSRITFCILSAWPAVKWSLQLS